MKHGNKRVSVSGKDGSKKSTPVKVSIPMSKKRVMQNMMKDKSIHPQSIKINLEDNFST